MGSKSLRFRDYEQATAKNRTRRERCLSENGDGGALESTADLIVPNYPKTNSQWSDADPLATMLRTHLLHQWDVLKRAPYTIQISYIELIYA